MRNDMFKVIVERPRAGSREKFSNIRHNSKMNDYLDESTSSKIGMRRLRGISGKDRKYLNENLQPLVRFLHSRVGNSWDQVFSEICENIDTDSTVQKHVRDHIRDYIEIDYRFQNGTKRGSNYPPFFFVDETGILRTNARNGETNYTYSFRQRVEDLKERRLKELDSVYRRIGDEELWKINGIWYMPVWKINDIWYDPISKVAGFDCFDIFTKKSVKYGDWYRYSKRTADRKTLRRFGVSND